MDEKWDDRPVDELEEGIERIRRMTQRISEAHDLVAANNRLLLRDRELMRNSPLAEARDLRTEETQLHGAHRPALRRQRRRR